MKTNNKSGNENPVKIYDGIGKIDSLPELIKPYGQKVLLVHGHRPVEDGLLEKVRVVLTNAGIEHTNMGQILPNPKFSSVERGVRIAKKEGAGFILSVGGGSTLQCAKGIAYGLANKGDLWDLWKRKKKVKGVAPVAAVLTNPASGDELNNNCTLVKDGKQRSFKSNFGYCHFAILDPNLSILPKYPTICQYFELFDFLFLRYLNAEKEQESAYFQLMNQLNTAVEKLIQNEGDLEARESLFTIGIKAHELSGKGISSFLNLTDRLAFSYSLPKGIAQSAVFFSFMENNLTVYQDKLASFGKSVFSIEADETNEAAKQGLTSFKTFCQKLGLAVCIPETGLTLKKKELRKVAYSEKGYSILKLANKKPE